MKSRLANLVLATIAASVSIAQSVPFELLGDRKPPIQTGGSCFVKGGKVITLHGEIENGSILIENGKIVAIGQNLTPPKGIKIIDASDKVIMAGIVDAHSHRGSDATNEGSDSVVSDVRITDVLNPSNKNIWQALASGQTSALILHGSANTIGGQSVVVKLKYGKPLEEMIVADAPKTIKFALGENVTRSGSETSTRFPRTRMGVEAVLRRAFEEARRYMAEWSEYERGNKKGDPPRRDLRLEALAGVLKREIWVHCHSYRADEILMLVRLSQEYGFKIGAMQHALEAYKILPELAEAGVGISVFFDSWSYKIEAYDSIPFATAMALRAGVNVSINTDSLGGTVAHNIDAAKSLRYGVSTPLDAIRTITINPAKQLGIDHRTGSLEVGKDADLSIWDGHPMSVYSRCAMTIIDGEVCFLRRDAFQVDAQSTLTKSIRPRSNDLTPMPPPSAAYAVVNATVHPVSSAPIENATVVIRGGRIEAVGASVSVPPDAATIDGAGLHLYPGFIDGGSTLGLNEIGSIGQMQDHAERGSFQPDALAQTALNFESAHYGVARWMGVTAAVTRPTGGVISGQGAVINLAGMTNEEMSVLNRAALYLNFPGSGRGFRGVHACCELDEEMHAGVVHEATEAVDAQTSAIDEYFEKAQKYAKAKSSDKPEPIDLPMEAMIPYINGTKPVVIRVSTASTIRDAIALAKKFGLRAILAGAADAWKETKLIADSGFPVIVNVPGRSTTFANNPLSETDPYDSMYALPAILKRAGIKFCFQSDSSADSMNLGNRAAQTCAYGMKPEDVIRALTLDAAQIFGVSNQLGSIENGKIANLVLYDGDPFEMTTRIRTLFINGQPVKLENRFTQFADKYSARIK